MPLPVPRKIAQLRDSGKVKHLSLRQEHQTATRLGGSVIARSGAGTKKGDVDHDLVRIEAKFTGNKSFSLTRGILDKNDEAALSAGKIPVITVQFLHPQTSVVEDEVAVVRFSDLEQLIIEASNWRRIRTAYVQCQ
jgi:hypothetical protein